MVGEGHSNPSKETRRKKSQAATKAHLNNVEAGTHVFLGGDVARKTATQKNKKRVDDGTHNFLGGEITRKQLENGTHVTQIRMSCIECRHETTLVWIGKHLEKHNK